MVCSSSASTELTAPEQRVQRGRVGWHLDHRAGGVAAKLLCLVSGVENACPKAQAELIGIGRLGSNQALRPAPWLWINKDWRSSNGARPIPALSGWLGVELVALGAWGPRYVDEASLLRTSPVR